MRALRLTLAGTLLILAFGMASPAQAARLYLTPAAGTYQPGETVTLQIRLDNEGECVNAAEVNIGYPKDLMEAVDVSRGDSIFSIWVTPPTIRPEFGLITFIGGIPGGYCGRTPGDPSLTNILAKAIFRFKSTSTASVAVLGSSKVVLNNGQGTETKVTARSAEFAVAMTGKPQRNEWTDAIREDKTPPEVFKVEIHRDKSIFDNKHFAVWSTIDKQTGLDHYEVAEVKTRKDAPAWKRADSPYVLSDQNLRSIVMIKAIDKAGNERTVEYEIPQPKRGPLNSLLFWGLASLAAIFFALLRYIRFIPW